MFDIGPEKIAVVLLIALLVMGPDKLPDIARSIGKGLREFRQALREFGTSWREA